MLFNSIYDIAAVETLVPRLNVLVLLAARSTIGFMKFDDSTSCFCYIGLRSLDSVYPLTTDASVRAWPRLLAMDPERVMVTVATRTS